MAEMWHSPLAATFSKSPKMFAQGFTPSEVARGEGCRVGDRTGTYLIDWVSALGANVLGYSNRDFNERLHGQILNGIGFSLPHVLEQQVGEKIATLLGKRVPNWTPEGLGWRFGLSGTDATTMAIRMARAVKATEHCSLHNENSLDIVSIGYHGWADWSISVTLPAWGIPQSQRVYNCPFNDPSELEEVLYHQHVAAVIIEHMPEEPVGGYYAEVRALCNVYGALLILDEVVTWPRYSLGGVCQLYGIEPDLICLGKGLGNGVPISCVVGRKEIFDFCFDRPDPVFISSTHFGNALSLAAADAVLDILTDDSVKHIWTIGKALMDGLGEAGYSVIGHPPRSLMQFDSLAEKTYFVLGMAEQGILINRPNLPNLAHSLADVEQTVKAAKEVKAEMAKVDVEELMKDRLPMVLFSNR